MKQFLSPKQAAITMGVSESSLKRWCDRGKFQIHRTAGGHRKIPVREVVRFLRETRREAARPDLLGLPTDLKPLRGPVSETVKPLAQALARGQFEAVQQLVFGHYLRGHTLAKLCDQLITPALATIGEEWNHGEIEIFEEHRAVQLTHRLLHELGSTLPAPASDAPLAMGGSVDQDVYGLPTQMIELALCELGWRATSLGPSLPFATLASAIRKHRPKLFWLSVSAVTDAATFLAELRSFAARVTPETSVFVGGRALTTDALKETQNTTYCSGIAELAERAQALFENNPRSRGTS